MAGSSPRLRGTCTPEAINLPSNGIIPALAGNIPILDYGRPLHRDHPRACGEHSMACGQRSDPAGSSPRLRGTLSLRGSSYDTPGIIPALAGNMVAIMLLRFLCRDHPRACGEHYTYDSADINSMGSSPRLRGTSGIPARRSHKSWIIPALAGNIKPKAGTAESPWDHPRACGEHLFDNFDTIIPRVSAGSSPRLRGTLFGAVGPVDRQWDHPRACGEHNRPIPPWYGAQGSSPRLRGT